MKRLSLAMLSAALLAASPLLARLPTPTPVPGPMAPTFEELQQRIRDLEWEAGTPHLQEINDALQAKIDADRKAKNDK